jgi:uncharacterized protein YlzI (FlbEa/FlbD family)
MIIKLTNAVTALQGRALFINTEHIIAIYEAEIEDKVVTFVYGTTKDSWQVQESIDEIDKILGLTT